MVEFDGCDCTSIADAFSSNNGLEDLGLVCRCEVKVLIKVEGFLVGFGGKSVGVVEIWAFDDGEVERIYIGCGLFMCVLEVRMEIVEVVEKRNECVCSVSPDNEDIIDVANKQ